jgi:hypothetical protein
MRCLGALLQRELGSRPMAKQDDYRNKAAETVNLANRAATSIAKGRLLALAEKWLDLADRANWVAIHGIGRIGPTHPLIRSKLPDRRPEFE